MGLQEVMPAFGDLIDSAGFSKGKVVKSSPLSISWCTALKYPAWIPPWFLLDKTSSASCQSCSAEKSRVQGDSEIKAWLVNELTGDLSKLHNPAYVS